MRIGMIGTGYVGLVSGTCFAEFGHDVTCVDKDAGKITRLEKGEIPIYEPGLDELVARQVKAGRLKFTTNLAEGVKGMDAVFIAVGTPPRNGDDGADLSQVFTAAREIAAAMDGYLVVVDKSTVPVGTAAKVTQAIAEARPGASFDVVSNPEFLREGAAIDDFMRPDRVVIGTHSTRAAEVMRALYRPLFLNETPMVVTTPESAELAKYAANAFLATKITFINEIARLCEATGGNVQDVARAIGLDGRIGSKFLHAGPGYGGSCFPKDTRALAQTGRDFNVPQSIVETVIDANTRTKEVMADKIIAACGSNVKGKKIAVLGVSFKPETDDMRDAPALTILPLLQQAGAVITAYDPVAMNNARTMLPNVTWAQDAYACADQSDALVIITEWNEFRALDLDRVAGMMNTPILVDLRNIYKTADMQNRPFQYVSIGRADVLPAPAKLKKVVG
jgi:UDPglucose 6-dehydrogenase